MSTSHRTPTNHLAIVIAFVVAMLATTIAPARAQEDLPANPQVEIADQITNALAAPSFVATFHEAELIDTAGGLPGLTSDDVARLSGLLADTRLASQPEFEGLFADRNADLFTTDPTYVSPVVVTTTEVLIDRTITFELEPGVCTDPNSRNALSDVCFNIDESAEMTPELAEDLEKTRDLLEGIHDDDAVAPGVTAAKAKTMTDSELLDLMMNTGPQTIRRLSTIPRMPDGSLAPVDPSVFADSSSGEGPATSPRLSALHPGIVDAIGGTAEHDDFYDFDTEYFLTGFTWGLNYGDSFEYEKDAIWHPRIFIGYSYSISAGIGVRAPFSIDVDHIGGDGTDRRMRVSADPVSLHVAADHVGLHDSLYFDGQEFVFELNVDCSFVVDLPGIAELTLRCDLPIGFDFSQDFDPVIGDETRNIENWWLWNDGDSPLRLEMFGGVVFGEVNVGMGADVINGRVGARIEGAGAVDVDGVNTDELTWFESRAGRTVDVDFTGTPGLHGGELEISDPHYAFSVAIRPKVKLTVGVDKIIRKHWSFVFPLDFLGASVRFDLDHHAGTVEQHSYPLWTGLVTEAPTAEDTAGDIAEDIGGGAADTASDPGGTVDPTPTPNIPPIRPPKLERDVGVGRTVPAN